MAMPNGNDKSKRGFDFRMSKKVAELTQVVHMLFTRNHEKEVELDALKEAYELEISEVIADARNRLAQVEKQLEDAAKHTAGEADKTRKLLEVEFLAREQELKRRAEESERALHEERGKCQNLRDMLIRAQRDIENLRHGVSQQMNSQADEVAKKEREVERLKKQVASLEQSLKDCGKESGDLIKELEKGHENLERDLRHVHTALEESHRTRDQLLVRNKQLEGDMKTLRRDFNRKVAEVVNGQKTQRNSVDYSQYADQDHNEELERLRREIQRYRLELSNRDINFNRMFTEKQPIHVDRASTGSGVVKLGTPTSAGPMHQINGLKNGMTLKREKTLSRLPPGPVIAFEDHPPQPASSDRQRSTSTPSVHTDIRDSRFPSICSTPEIKTRPSTNSRLVKPKPLPKEMLYGK